ncbi:hypothetical protein KM043_009090 [Ampulex compressa]|nr:hypothetical protein KM043_009090 [Ampulex compressa]
MVGESMRETDWRRGEWKTGSAVLPVSAPSCALVVTTDRPRSTIKNHVKSVVERPAKSSLRPEKRAGRL